jgi:hypothetical protein
MELFLNILWVLIALGALALWRLDWKHQERRASPNLLQEWTAFVCVLVFVFFAVSLSDDLHAEAILADDCARGRNHALVSDCGHHARQSAIRIHAGPPAVLPRVSFFAPARVFAPAVCAPTAFAITREFRFGANRAPPVLPS